MKVYFYLGCSFGVLQCNVSIFVLLLVYASSLMMSSGHSHHHFIKCPDCNCISLSQGGLRVHRSKRHNISIPDDVKLIYVERIFPEGKQIYCCLCDVTIGTIQNFRRHMKYKHAKIKLIESTKCSLCFQKFPEGRAQASTLNIVTTSALKICTLFLLHQSCPNPNINPNPPPPIPSTILCAPLLKIPSTTPLSRF